MCTSFNHLLSVKALRLGVLCPLLIVFLQSCAPKSPDSTVGAPPPASSDKIHEGPLTPEPPEVALPFEGILSRERSVFESVGYSFRLPLGWGTPLEATVPNSDLVLQNPEGDSSIIIARKANDAMEHYGHWLRFEDVFRQSIETQLSEVQILETHRKNLAGKVAIVVEHTHFAAGARRYSKKVAIWATDEVVIVNCDTTTALREARLPIFDAFLSEFQLLDPTRAVLPPWEIDYVAEMRDPERDIVLPIQRSLVQVEVRPEMKGIFARWVYPPNTVSLGEHFLQYELKGYGDVQRDQMKNIPDIIVEQSEVVEFSGREVYRIEYLVGQESRSVMYIFRAPRRFYQLIFGTDVFSFPYVEGVFEDMARRFQYPEVS